MDPLSLGIGLVSSLFSGFGSRKKAKRAREEQEKYEKKLKFLENNRQEIINPYESIKDLSDMVTNPFANLQVATKAAEIQAEQADLSLANTLDTLRATGASAGGATALAQAALRSKQGVSASIEKQEAMNTRLRAQGEQKMQQIRMSEAGRVQGAEARGAAFEFGAKERRQSEQLDRVSGQAAGAARRASAYSSQANSAFGSALGAFGGLAVGTKGFGLFNPTVGSTGRGMVNTVGSVTTSGIDRGISGTILN